jgi:branched-chain amino acid transport system substrate-binding protein
MRIQRRTFGKLAAGAAAGLAAPAIAQNKPFTIGFSMNLTGPLAPNGKAALLAMQIWEEDINAKGGLLGRPVKLIYYDDQSNPSTVPGLYTKLLDVDKVDIIASSYATNIIAPAMPIVMQHERTFFSLLGLAVNSEFNYKRYFSMTPTGGPQPKESFAVGFFELAAEQTPKPQTVAICGADAEFPRNAMDGARSVMKRLGLKVVYDKTYPPTTSDYADRAPSRPPTRHFPYCFRSRRHGRHHPEQKSASSPNSTVAAWSAAGDRHQRQLGPLLNGIVVYDFWLPWAGFASDTPS